jgi:hypothetical protein
MCTLVYSLAALQADLQDPFLGPPTRTTDLTEKTERLASDKSIASFRHVYNRPIDEDDIKEADALAKAQADKPFDLTRTQFKFSKEQLEQDRQKAQDGPLSTGMSMSMAAKTTPSTRLKLKEAQDEIAELRLALAQHAVLNPPAASFQSTKSPPEVTPQPPDKDSDNRQANAFTKNQASGAAISKPFLHDAIQVDSNAMEEDCHEPTVIGSSSSDSASGDLSKQNASVLSESEKAEYKSMKKSSRLLSVLAVQGIKLSKDFVQGVQQGAAHLGQLPFVTLRHCYKVVHENVGFLEGSFACASVVRPHQGG